MDKCACDEKSTSHCHFISSFEHVEWVQTTKKIITAIFNNVVKYVGLGKGQLSMDLSCL
jgi:hypothetical protein